MLEKEIWKPVVFIKNGVSYDFIGKYEVSNLGNVRNINYRNTGKARMLNPWTDKYGYKYVGLVKEGKTINISIHRLVAFAFVENPQPNDYNVVNHKNEITSDNRSCNLEWCNNEYNLQYGTVIQRRLMSKKKEQPKVICIETGKVFDDIESAAKYYQTDIIDSSSLGKAKIIKGRYFILYEDWLNLTEGIEVKFEEEGDVNDANIQ